MRINPPAPAPAIDLKDMHGNPLVIANGRPTLLSFFRDAACPFCNVRIYELTKRYEELAFEGLNIVAIFASSPEQVRAFVFHRPRPFAIAADPEKTTYDTYGIGNSFGGKLRAIFTRVGTLIRGLRLVGLAGLNTNNVMPADFLISPDGHIVEAYYGVDAGDRIAFEKIEKFAAEYRS